MAEQGSIAVNRPRRTIVPPARFIVSYSTDSEEAKITESKNKQRYETKQMTLAEMQAHEAQLDAILGPVDETEAQIAEQGDENEDDIDAAAQAEDDGFVENDVANNDPDAEWRPETASDSEATDDDEISDEDDISDEDSTPQEEDDLEEIEDDSESSGDDDDDDVDTAENMQLTPLTTGTANPPPPPPPDLNL